MRHDVFVTCGYAITLSVLTGCSTPREVSWQMHTINADSRFEGASVFDVDRDGDVDIFCGSYWYEAPDWDRHFVREIEERGNYYLDFCALPVDVDGDGWTDVISAAWHNKRVSWIKHPGNVESAWTEIPIDEPGNMETAMLADLNDDGQPDVVPNIFIGEPGWYTFQQDPAAEHGVTWTKHPLSAAMAGPGVGVGDVDGDGRADVVGCKGFAAQPTDANGDWTWHAEFDLVDPGIPIQICDIDRDGDADIIWGIGHDYGLYWLEQGCDEGVRTWTKHEIDKSYSQAHVVLLGDLDLDGHPELVTGKRWHAHNGNDPGGKEPRCLYWYRFDAKTKTWQRNIIHERGPASIGTMTELADIDDDGDLDLVAPGKSGLYLFENLAK